MAIRFFLSPMDTRVEDGITRNCVKIGLKKTVVKPVFSILLHENELRSVKVKKYAFQEWSSSISKNRTVALVRMIMDESEIVDSADIEYELTTETQWLTLYAEYSEFIGVWSDQPF